MKISLREKSLYAELVAEQKEAYQECLRRELREPKGQKKFVQEYQWKLKAFEKLARIIGI